MNRHYCLVKYYIFNQMFLYLKIQNAVETGFRWSELGMVGL